MEMTRVKFLKGCVGADGCFDPGETAAIASSRARKLAAAGTVEILAGPAFPEGAAGETVAPPAETDPASGDPAPELIETNARRGAPETTARRRNR